MPEENTEPKGVEIEFRVALVIPKSLARDQLTSLLNNFARDLVDQLHTAELTAVGWSQNRRVRMRRRHINPRRRITQPPPKTEDKPN